MEMTLWQAFAKLPTQQRNVLTEIWAENCHRIGGTYPFADMLAECAGDAKTLATATENLTATADAILRDYSDGYEWCNACPTHCTDPDRDEIPATVKP